MQKEEEKAGEAEAKLTQIQTMVRVRPLLESEADFKESIKCPDQKTLQISLSGQLRQEKVQKVFPPNSTQRQVFSFIQEIVNKCGLGYNVTIFTYGQTGSGKTHTMFGSDWNNVLKDKMTNSFKATSQKKSAQETFLRFIEQDENHSGLIPRTIHFLFNHIVTKRPKYIKVYCSFLQLYNQTMLDLFEDDPKKAKDKKMLIHQNPNDGIYVQGLNEMAVQSVEQCLELMKKGEKNRVVRQTSMNIKSSRSHTIFQLLLEEVFPAKKSYRRMKLNLCDLAGSQKINKSENMQSGHFEELRNINLSLTTLGKVISSLSEKQKPPFRESKLTRLLQDSLGGNTYTAIIATVTPKSTCLEESLNTLKFLERAKQIKTQIVSKQIYSNPEVKNLEKEINYLKDILKMKRNGADVMDIDLSEKYQKLQRENARLKEMVDQELIEKLIKENTQLKIRLESRHNDELSDSFIKSGYTFKSILSPAKQYRTIGETETKQVLNSQKDEDVKSDCPGSLQKYRETGKLAQKGYVCARSTAGYGRSAGGTSITKSESKSKVVFPSLPKKGGGGGSVNKILDRIQQIERVKLGNKLRLEKELESMSMNSIDKTKMSFARSSKYSSKYRY